MNSPNMKNKPIVAVAVALVVVLLLVIALFAFGQQDSAHADITLPEPQIDNEPDRPDTEGSNDSLLQVTPENAADALKSLWKPEYYHQTYNVTVRAGEEASQYTVELWANGDVRRAEVASANDKKIILANEREVYLWYTSDARPVHVDLNANVTFEDMLGLPAFDYLQTLQNLDITDAEYLVVDEEQQEIPCIFFSLQETHGPVSRYWIDLTTGLLYMADCLETDEQVYFVEQIGFDRLAAGDESFAEKFMLPDGTGVFIEETKMRQRQ